MNIKLCGYCQRQKYIFHEAVLFIKPLSMALRSLINGTASVFNTEREQNYI